MLSSEARNDRRCFVRCVSRLENDAHEYGRLDYDLEALDVVRNETL